jgi:hypothetical protein
VAEDAQTSISHHQRVSECHQLPGSATRRPSWRSGQNGELCTPCRTLLPYHLDQSLNSLDRSQ